MVDTITRWAKRYAAIIMLLFGLAVLGIVTGGDVYKMQATVNSAFGDVVAAMFTVLFWEIPFTPMPLVVFVLIGGAVFFTFRFGFINIRGVRHAIDIVRGKFDDEDDPGEVTHFQALSSALSATVGLGNIAGVAIAVSVGGPGAVFWMMCAAVFGMTSKFAECTLGQMYRQVDKNGNVRGGPMVYLREGLGEMGFPRFGKVLSVVFAILCIGGSFGGGNMFQANQSFAAMASLVPALGGEKATGNVRVWSNEPRELELEDHQIQFIAPGDQEAGIKDRIYNPTSDVSIGAGQWLAADGGYYVDIESKALESNTIYNVDKEAVAAVQIARVKGREVKWATPGPRVGVLDLLGKGYDRYAVGEVLDSEAYVGEYGEIISTETAGMKATNVEKFRGGTGHLGWLYGLLLAVLVGIVIVGGIKRIGNVADKIVPFMCVLYVLSAIAVIIIHWRDVPEAISTIFTMAFTDNAVFGGLIGVFIQGVRRAAFSNEAGVGSAAIAHSAAKTKHPVREGLVALLEPAIDTLIVCLMTGIVIVITGVWKDPAMVGLDGVLLTSAAFGEALSAWASYLLSAAVILFAFSTMISWSYYGERCWSFLFGPDQTFPYRILFCMFVWLGCVASLGNVLDFSDLMILSMAFPNIIGVIFLSGKVARALEKYWQSHKDGEFEDGE